MFIQQEQTKRLAIGEEVQQISRKLRLNDDDDQGPNVNYKKHDELETNSLSEFDVDNDMRQIFYQKVIPIQTYLGFYKYQSRREFEKIPKFLTWNQFNTKETRVVHWIKVICLIRYIWLLICLMKRIKTNYQICMC